MFFLAKMLFHALHASVCCYGNLGYLDLIVCTVVEVTLCFFLFVECRHRQMLHTSPAMLL